MRNISKLFKDNKKRAIIILVVVFVLLTAGGFAVQSNRDDQKITPQPENTQKESEDDKKDNKATDESTKNSSPSNTSGTSTSGPTAPVSFSISGINVHNPEYSYNKDKLGNTIRACQVLADITSTAAGTATYYWDTYHPEYFNPSNRGPDETVTFEGKGTKTVKLNTYTSNDSRRFTLYVISPNNISKPTGTQVWCKAD